MHDTLIIGGGITGLTAAYSLQQKKPHATYGLLESSSRLGGKVATHRIDTPEGPFLLEQAADCFLTSKPAGLQLAHALGLTDQLLPTNDANRVIFVRKNQKSIPLPAGTMLIVPTQLWPFIFSPLFSPAGKLRMGLDLLLPRAKNLPDESIASFIRRRLGNEALNLLAEPLLSGIYNADPEHQSLQATFPQLAHLERCHRSLIMGMLTRKAPTSSASSLFISFKNGMQTLTDTLARALHGDIFCNTQVTHINRNIDSTYTVTTSHKIFHAKNIILTTPSHIAGQLLQTICPQASQLLNAFTTTSSGAVFLAYRNQDLNRIPQGFGIVIPKQEKRPISAITYVSNKLHHRAPSHCTLLRVFFGASGQEALRAPDEELITLAQQQVAEILGIHAAPLFTRAFRMPHASPQYNVGHLERVRQLETLLPTGLYLAGSPYKGVGIPDCIASAVDLPS